MSSFNIQNDISNIVAKYVSELSKKYEFDEKDALEFLNIDMANMNLDSKKKTKKGKKSTDNGEKKPRKKSGYSLFSSSVRQEVKQELIDNEKESTLIDVNRAISARWKEAGDEEKAEWNNKAKSENDKQPVEVEISENSENSD